MTTPKAKLAGLALIAAMCGGFTLGLTAPAWAGWDEGWEAYKHPDYATATREFMALAEQGDARPQITLQIMEMLDELDPWDLHKLNDKLEKWLDKGDAPKFKEAVKWFRNAVNQGDTKAWTLLGFMYEGGFGVPKDFDEAEKLLLKAAQQGEVTAQKFLAFSLAFQNKMTESEYWTRKAAEQGDRWGQWGLGLLYKASGDKVRAYMWLTLAVAQGGRAAAKGGKVYNLGDLAKGMSREQIAEAQKLAREWRPK